MREFIISVFTLLILKCILTNPAIICVQLIVVHKITACGIVYYYNIMYYCQFTLFYDICDLVKTDDMLPWRQVWVSQVKHMYGVLEV